MKIFMKLSFLLISIFIANLIFAQTNTLYIGAPTAKKTKIAIAPFEIPEKVADITPQDSLKYAERMRSLLNFTGWFSFVDNTLLPAKTNNSYLPFKQEAWNSLQLDYVLLGKITREEKYISLELRLYDIKANKLALGKIFSNLIPSTLDTAMRRYTDLIIEVITGQLGPFMSKIAFVGSKQKGEVNRQLYIANIDGSELQQVTDNNTINMSPSWSPDGARLTYTSFQQGKAEVYLYNVLTKSSFSITSDSDKPSFSATWSSDQKNIAYASSVGKGRTSLFLMSSFGAQKQPLISEGDINVEPSFSPNGKYLAYTSNRFAKPMIFLRDLALKTDKRLTYSGWYNASPSWSPDSQKISFASYDRDIDRWDLFKMNADGSNTERLTLNQGDNEKPTWSPDGRFILFQSNRMSGSSAVGKVTKLYIMNSDGSSVREISLPLAEAKLPSWGPRLELQL